MSDRIRRVGYRGTQYEDIFDEVSKDFAPVEGGDVTDTEIEYEEVEESETFVLDKFREEVVKPQDEDEFELGSIRERGWRAEEIDLDSNEGVEFAKGSTDLQTRMEKYSEINQQLDDKGINRRYIVGDVHAPSSAHVFEDSIGKYYYAMDHSLRPSTVTKVVNEDSWFEIPRERRTKATVLLLGKAYPWHTHEAKTERAVESLLERALITETDELETEDVFSKERVQEVKEVLLDR